MKKNNLLKNIKSFYLSSLAFIAVNIASNKYCFANTGQKFMESFNDLSDFVGTLTNGMMAFSMLSGIAVLLYHVVQLALVGNNPNERSKVLKNLCTSMICMGLLGSIGLIMSLIMFYTGI